jgi:hypothetical protein
VIYTFYSFKGGVGRSMALANVARYLSLQGLDVIMVDWDLEAPGLEEFFFDTPGDVEGARAHPGLLDTLLAYKRTCPAIRPRLVIPAREGEVPDPALAEGGDRAASILAVRRRNAALLKELLPPLSNALFTVHPASDGRPPIRLAQAADRGLAGRPTVPGICGRRTVVRLGRILYRLCW